MLDKKSINYDNVREHEHSPPIGYEFSYKGLHALTRKAKGHLFGYWNNVVNENSSAEDLKNDIENGLDTRSIREWNLKYNMRQAQYTGLLLAGKFIKSL